MNKILLFVFLSVASLNGMERNAQSILEVHDNIEDVVLAIRVGSLNYGELKQMVEDDHEFTKLVHVLANKFKIPTRSIAQKFVKTPIAGQYVTLGDALINFSAGRDRSALIKLIIQGADVNYSALYGFTPLIMAVKAQADPEIIQLLLDSGADASLKDEKGFVALDYVDKEYRDESEKWEISEMLQNAMRLILK